MHLNTECKSFWEKVENHYNLKGKKLILNTENRSIEEKEYIPPSPQDLATQGLFSNITKSL
jgi:hypothetical protein